jgi:hypothetical protein
MVNQKISRWFTLSQQPGLARKDREAARRNYRKLIRTYPKIAKAKGWTEERLLSAA